MTVWEGIKLGKARFDAAADKFFDALIAVGALVMIVTLGLYTNGSDILVSVTEFLSWAGALTG